MKKEIIKMIKNKKETEKMINEPTYIACPYWHEENKIRLQRVAESTKYASHLIKKGTEKFIPYSPLTHNQPLEEETKGTITQNEWYTHGLALLKGCKEMHVLAINGWKQSTGIRLEIIQAQENNIKIKYIKKDKKNWITINPQIYQKTTIQRNDGKETDIYTPIEWNKEITEIAKSNYIKTEKTRIYEEPDINIEIKHTPRNRMRIILNGQWNSKQITKEILKIIQQQKENK